MSVKPKPDGLVRAGELLPEILPAFESLPKPLTPIQERLVSMPAGEAETIVYQHSVLCQTSLPYRDPGEEIRAWQRTNGVVSLRIEAGSAYDASQDAWIEVGLPHGPKPRLVLYHLNTEALRTQSPAIELEDSLTAFVKRTLGLDSQGRNIRTVRDQLARLAAADFRFGMNNEGRSVTIKGTVIEGFELWTPKNANQRVLWPTTIQFSERYFRNLMEHAVPLNEAAVKRLQHSAMALDVYTWLAQRLHRINPEKPALVPWTALEEQFGQGYSRLVDFRRKFLATLRQVQAVYRTARFAVDGKGMHLRHSPPPIMKTILLKP